MLASFEVKVTIFAYWILCDDYIQYLYAYAWYWKWQYWILCDSICILDPIWRSYSTSICIRMILEVTDKKWFQSIYCLACAHSTSNKLWQIVDFKSLLFFINYFDNNMTSKCLPGSKGLVWRGNRLETRNIFLYYIGRSKSNVQENGWFFKEYLLTTLSPFAGPSRSGRCCALVFHRGFSSVDHASTKDWTFESFYSSSFCNCLALLDAIWGETMWCGPSQSIPLGDVKEGFGVFFVELMGLLRRRICQRVLF